MKIMSGLLEGLRGLNVQYDGIAQWGFFKLIFDFLDDEVEVFRDNLLGETMAWVGGVVLVLLTIWILWQGYQIMTGRSRESLMVLVVSSLRSVLIVSVATTLAFGSSNLYRTFTDGMPREIMQVVTGDDDAPADKIDQSLNQMAAAMIGIDALSAMGDPGLKEDKDRAILLTGVGVAGPAVIGGALLLLYKIALALFIGLGPLFILSLLFEQTKSLFSRWLYYGISTMFSLAVLSFMVAVAMKLVLVVATTFAAQYLAAMALGLSAEGVNSMALQQGGLGLIMTVLLIMTPPMAAAFFGGALGNFSAYSQFGATGQPRDATGRQVGTGYVPQPVQRDQSLGPIETGRFNNPALAGTPTSSYVANPDVVRTGSNAPRGG